MWISLLLRIWPYILGGIVALGLILLVNHWRLEANRVPALEEQVSTLQAQIIAEREQVKKNQQLTANIESSYARKITNLNISLKRLHNQAAACIPVQSAAKAGINPGTTPGAIPIGTPGISSLWLYDFGGEAETYRLRLLGCQDFINQVYKANP